MSRCYRGVFQKRGKEEASVWRTKFLQNWYASKTESRLFDGPTEKGRSQHVRRNEWLNNKEVLIFPDAIKPLKLLDNSRIKKSSKRHNNAPKGNCEQRGKHLRSGFNSHRPDHFSLGAGWRRSSNASNRACPAPKRKKALESHL
jgi:hypothetical protein